MADDRVTSVGSLGHDSEPDRERCRTKEPPGPQSILRRTSRTNEYMKHRRDRDASSNKLALRTQQSPQHSSEEASKGKRSIIGLVSLVRR